jgi:hypothetical protein
MSDIPTGRMLLELLAQTLPKDKAKELRAIIRDYFTREYKHNTEARKGKS